MQRTRARAAEVLGLLLLVAGCGEQVVLPIGPTDAGATPPVPDAGPPQDAGCVVRTTDDGWEPTGGPGGGPIHAIASDGASWIVVSTVDAFRVDAGGLWQPIDVPGDVTPTSPLGGGEGAFFLGTSDGLFRSTDAGASWSPADDGAPPDLRRVDFTEVGFVAMGANAWAVWSGSRWEPVDAPPLDSDELREVVPVTDGWVARAFSQQGYRWTEAGGWERMSALGQFVDLEASGARIYSLGAGGNVSVSDDGGQSWIHRIRLITTTSPESLVRAQDGALWLLGLGGQLWRSEDDGVSFEELPDLGFELVYARPTTSEQRFAQRDDGAILFADGATVVRSAGGSAIEVSVSPVPGPIGALGAADGFAVAVTHELSVFLYDGAWRHVGRLPGRAFGGASAVEVQGEVWIGTAGGGVYGVTPAGELGTRGLGLPSFNGSAGRQTFGVTALAPYRGAVFAGTVTTAFGSDVGAGIYRLLLGGVDWLPVNGGLRVIDTDTIGRPLRQRQTALVVYDDRLLAGGIGIRYLDRRTGRWAGTSIGEDLVVALAANRDGVLGVASNVSSTWRVLRSADGLLFEPGPIPTDAPAGLAAFGHEAWLAGEDGLWRSTDLGVTWEPDGHAAQRSLSSTALAASSTDLWLATPQGVLRRPLTCEEE